MATHQNVLARAKQGDAEAIASLMNRTLNKQNRHVRVLRQSAQLKLLVESTTEPPEQASTVHWIENGLRKLAIADIETAIVYGKSQQSAKPVWQQTIILAQDSPSKDPFAPDEPAQSKPSEPALDLTDYCFTRNKSLLSGNLTLPSKSVIQLVLSFSALTNTQKQEILPHLDKALRKPDAAINEPISDDSKAWLAQVAELEGPEVRKASIWMSRYCLDAIATVAQLDPPVPKAEPAPVADTPAEPNESLEIDASSNAQPFPSTHTHQAISRSPRTASAASLANRNQTVLFSAGSRMPAWVIPAAWSLFLFIAVGVSVSRANSAYYGYSVCENALGTPEMCSLAVEVVGYEEAFTEILEDAVPLTADMRAHAIANCSEYGYTEFTSAPPIGTSSRPNRENAVTILASNTEEILPGVLIADITQTDTNAAGIASRYACIGYAYEFDPAGYEGVQDSELYQALKDQSGYETLGIDEIPMDWPTEPYSGLMDLVQEMEKTTGVYNVFVDFGANTLFAAVGLFFAVLLCQSYSCQTVNALYQAAFAMGAFETVVSMMPVGGFRFQLAVVSLGLGVASMFIKDFKVDWSEGYGSVAIGSSIVIFVRFVLSIGLYGIISMLVN